MCVCGVWGVCVTDLLRGLGTCRGQRTTDRSWFLLPCGSRYQTQVTNLGSQCPYCLRSLAHPMGSVSVTFIVVAVVKFLQCETTFYCQSEFCVSLLIFNPQLHFSDWRIRFVLFNFLWPTLIVVKHTPLAQANVLAYGRNSDCPWETSSGSLTIGQPPENGANERRSQPDPVAVDITKQQGVHVQGNPSPKKFSFSFCETVSHCSPCWLGSHYLASIKFMAILLGGLKMLLVIGVKGQETRKGWTNW